MSKYARLNSNDEYTGLTMAGRESGLRKLMNANLLKRLESSVNSFRLTIERIRSFISSTLQKIDETDSYENYGMVAEYEMPYGLDMDDEDSIFIGGKRTLMLYGRIS